MIYSALFVFDDAVMATGGEVCGVTLSYYRYGIEINSHQINEGNYVEVDCGSYIIVVIQRCIGVGSDPYYCCFMSEYNSYTDCKSTSLTYPSFYWPVLFPYGCFLCGASCDDDIWNFHICGEGWFDVQTPTEGQIMNKGEDYIIRWNTDIHCGGSCSSVSIYLCEEDSEDDDLTVPVVHQIASQVANSGSYAWNVDCEEVNDDNYRIMVVCGPATGYSDVFEIAGECCPDLEVSNFNVTHEEVSDNDGIVEPTDRFNIRCSFRVTNVGGETAPSCYYEVLNKVYDGCVSPSGALVSDNGVIPSLPPGFYEDFSEVCDSNVLRGCYEYWIFADSDDVIVECDESNNSNSSCVPVVRTKEFSWGKIKALYK